MTPYAVGILIPDNQLQSEERLVARQMAPYNEYLRVKPYVCFDVERAAAERTLSIDDMQRRLAVNPRGVCADFYRSRLERLRGMTPQQYYVEYVASHAALGEPLSTINPQGRWSSYLISVNYDGWLFVRSRKWRSYPDRRLDVADVLTGGDLPHALITPDGRWHERGQLLDSGEILGDKGLEAWHTEARRLLQQHATLRMVRVEALSACVKYTLERLC